MRRIPIGYILLTALVTLAVTFGAMSVFNAQNPSAQPEQIVITVPILITTTPQPGSSPNVIIVTATPGAGTPNVVALPPGLIDATVPASTNGLVAPTREGAPTLDPAIVGASDSLASTAAALPPDCISHTLAEGDTPFAIAEEYGANGFDLLAVNGLTEDDSVFLQIGDVLIVPLTGCSLITAAQEATEANEQITPTVTATPTITGTPATPTYTPSVSSTPSNTPTATLPATATNAQVEILSVNSAGVITAEGVDIRNNNAIIDLNNWTLTDGQDNVYTFPEQRLFQGGLVTLFTRVGTDTAIALFWNRDTAVFESGDTLTLSDSTGRVQSTFRVP